MNDFFVVKSACFLAGFALIYIIFLRNERFFGLKRVYLAAGLIFSCVLPLVTIHQKIPLITGSQSFIDGGEYIPDLSYELPVSQPEIDFTGILVIIYFCGIIVLFLRLFRHIVTAAIVINKSRPGIKGSVRIVRTDRYSYSFSFFSYVIINPSAEGEYLNEIIKHELVHIRQKHWIDLVLSEIIRIVQWFNPFAWIYISLIKENHEYLADAGALKHSPDPSVYKTALLNQIFRAPVLSASNSFSYSLNKKRFEMMKMIVTSPCRKLKTFLILPVIAAILYAFSEPVYVESATSIIADKIITPENTSEVSGDSLQKTDVTGYVLREDGSPFESASVAVTGSTLREQTDNKGRFVLTGIPEKSYLLFSAKGYLTQVLKPDFKGSMTVKLLKDPDYVPQSSGAQYLPDLLVIDGAVYEGNTSEKIKSIPTNEIARLNVIRGANAVRKYGEKAANGVIEVTTIKSKGYDTIRKSSTDVPFVVVEEMPMYIGGDQEILRTIAENTVYPEKARLNGIEGRVILRFVVTAEGKVDDVVVLKGVDPELDREAVRVVGLLNDFIPGRQGGVAVPVYYMVPVTFSLPLFTEDSRKILLKFMASNLVYPAGARANEITGKVLVHVKTEKGGIIREVSIADSNSQIPRVPEVVIIGYKTTASDLKGDKKGDFGLLEKEALRVANMIGSAGVPEFMQKDMEFIIPVTFDLRER